MSRIAVIGTGYVGLSTGAYLAHIGHEVVCADVVADKIARLARGEVPIFEAGLEDLVRSGLDSGLLRFVLGSEAAVPGAEFVFLCLPTPQGDDGAADLSYMQAEADHLGPLLEPGSIVINKSTVPVGSTRLVQRSLQRGDVFVVSNPEFLREGTAVHDCLNPDRIVIGADDAAAASRVAALYDRIHAPVVVTDPASAELIKYASNAFLATKISYINAIANLCEAVGADVKEVVLGMGYDKRIGFEFLRPGPGWGGSCFPKDTKALVRIAEDAGYDFGLLEGVIEVNIEQYERMTDKIAQAAPDGVLDGSTVAVWGLTFKALTDDLRDSPALEVVGRLLRRGAQVRAYDPMVDHRRAAGDTRFDGVTICSDPYAACTGADVVALLTEWDEFRWLDFDKVSSLLRARAVVDCRNVLDPAAMRKRGFAYHGVGRE
jgi:UDPglucose 6-dehydrogenase